MLMMTSQILKSMDSTKTQKYQYLESETLFFYSNKGYFMTENSFVAVVTFKVQNKYKKHKSNSFRDW